MVFKEPKKYYYCEHTLPDNKGCVKDYIEDEATYCRSFKKAGKTKNHNKKSVDSRDLYGKDRQAVVFEDLRRFGDSPGGIIGGRKKMAINHLRHQKSKL